MRKMTNTGLENLSIDRPMHLDNLRLYKNITY